MKKLIIGIIVIVGLVIIALYATTPRSWGHDTDPTVTDWQTSPMPREDLGQFEPTANVTADRGRRLRVKRWHTFTRRRQQLTTERGQNICGPRGGSATRAHVRLIGGNAMIPDIVKADMTVAWCYWNDDMRGKVIVNTHGDGRLLWEWQGVTDRNVGGGTNPHGVEYAYRRLYFKWTRPAVSSLPGMHAEGWIAMTVRGDGTCTADKYQQDGTTGC